MTNRRWLLMMLPLALTLVITANVFVPTSLLLETRPVFAQGQVSCATPIYSPPITFPVAGGPIAVAGGDVNGDGSLDLAVAAAAANAVSVALGNGDGTFAAPTVFAVGTRPLDVRTGDFNGDMRVDLVTANEDSNNVSLLLGNGQGGFGAATSFNAGAAPNSIAVGDLNGDLRPDLAVANIDSNNVSILLNNGQGGFGAATNFTVGTRPDFVALGDFNLDGRLDVVTANELGSNISVLLNNGQGGFGAATNFTVGNFPRAIAVGDFNGDNRNDLAVLNTGSDSISVLVNTCNATPCAAPSFAAAVNIPSGAVASDAIVAGDFNGDGRLDLAVDGFTQVAVLSGDGQGGFAAAVNFNVNDVVNFVTAGHVNADNRLDFIVTTVANPSGGVLLNACGSPRIEVMPADLAFGDVFFGESRDLSITVRNPGDSPLTVNSFAISEPSYSVVSPMTPFTLQSGELQMVNVRFAPTVPGNLNANLMIASNSLERPAVTVQLRGRGVDPCIYTISPARQSFSSSGGAGRVNVTAPNGCNWTAAGNLPWVTITAGASGSGNGTVEYEVAANTGMGFRSGLLTIARNTFAVIQGTFQSGAWNRVPSGTNNVLNAVDFADAEEGWAAGANGTLLRTTDEGASWVPVTIPDFAPSRGFNSVRFLTPQLGWFGGLQAVVRTVDGGMNFTGLQFTDNTPFRNSLFPVSETVAWAVGGGTTAGQPARVFFRFTFNPNGSITTFSQSNVSSDLLQDVFFPDPDNGWAAGAPGRIVRINNANPSFPTFTNQTSGTSAQLNAVHMLDANTGWVVGNNGTILKTTNGGTNWNPQASGVMVNLNDVDFINANRGWTVGDGGTILSTTNGGMTWAAEISGVTDDLRGVSFVNTEAGYVVGANGTILKKVGTATAVVTSVSAASFVGMEIAGESIVAAFGQGLATSTQAAATLPLPTELGGVRVEVRDAAGSVRSCALFFASGNQINLQIPPGTVEGPATINVIRSGTIVATGMVTIARVAPGLFAANADGTGVAAASALRIKPDGTRIDEPAAVFDQGQTRFVPVPIDLDSETDQVFLLLFGTGIRFNSGLPGVTVQIGGMNQEVLYAGPQGAFVGLDQLNVRLSRQLIGRGEVDVVLTVDGKTANTVRIAIK